MSDAPAEQGQNGPDNTDAPNNGDFQVTDNRKFDPTTGEVRGAKAMSDDEVNARIQGLDFTPTDTGDPSGGRAGFGGSFAAPAVDNAAYEAAKAEAAGYLNDLQRERASFTNYRNRALRDQEAARVNGQQEVLNALLPALDQIELAKSHGDLSGPMEAIANQIDTALGKFGVVRYGAPGEPFDPNIHEALMHRSEEGAEADTVDTVLAPGYKIGEKIVRPARVGVVGP